MIGRDGYEAPVVLLHHVVHTCACVRAHRIRTWENEDSTNGCVEVAADSWKNFIRIYFVGTRNILFDILPLGFPCVVIQG